MVFDFPWKTTFNQWYLNCVIFYITANISIFTVHVPNLMTVEFLFIKSQFRTNAKNIFHLNQWRHEHVWSWTFAAFQSPGAVSNGLSGIKNASVKCLFIFNWSYLTIDKKLNNRGRANVGIVPSELNVCRSIWIRIVLLVFARGVFTPEIFLSILGTACIVTSHYDNALKY